MRTTPLSLSRFVCLFLIGLTGFAGRLSAQTCVPAPSGLVSWWRGEGVATDALAAHNGIVSGGVTFSPGKVGQAFSLDGVNGAVDFGSWLNLQEFSVGLWVNPNASQPSSANLIDNNHTDFRSWGVQCNNAGLQYFWYSGNFGKIFFDLTPNTWQYLTFTVDSNHVARVYVNGVLQGTVTGSGPLVYDGTEFLRLGRWGTGGRYFNGLLDEVDVYNRALSVSEIQTLYNASAGKCPPPPEPPPSGECLPAPSGLVSWWRGESTAADATGAHNGTADGGVSFAAGKVGQAFSLDGINDSVDLGSWLNAQVFSVGLWVNPKASQPSSAVLIDNNHTDFRSWGVQRNTGLQFFWYSGNFGKIFFDLNPDTWQYLTFTVDSNHVARVYLNGVLQGTVTGSGPLVYDGTEFLRLGRWGTGGRYFNGLLDEVDVYNRALSAAEIQTLYNASAGKCVPTLPPDPPPSGECLPVPAGLTSWWRGEGTAEDATGAHNGTADGGVSFAAGKVGQAFSLDGINDSVDLGGWLNAQVFSVGLWVNPSASQQSSADIIDNNHTDFRSWGVQRNTGLQFFWYSGNFGKIFFDLIPNTWQYLAFTVDSNHVARVYLNGVLQGTVTGSGPLVYDGTEFLRLGRWGTGGRYFNGLLDEVDVYNRALSAAEIQALYNAGSVGKCVPTPPPSGECTPLASGAVSWWPAQNSPADQLDGNNGILQNGANYAAGLVGQAFQFGTSNAGVRIPAAANLNVGLSNSMTIEGWINPTDITKSGPLVEWNNGTNGWGVHFHIDPFSFGVGPGALYANIVDSGGGWHQIISPAGIVTSGVFQHVAMTYSRLSGIATLYRNGAIVAQQNLGSFIPLTSFDLYLGRRASGAPGDVYSFAGRIDEMTLYSRALSQAEIQAVYNAGSGGKCVPSSPPPQPSNAPPVIFAFSPAHAQPGDDVTISGFNFSSIPASNVVYFGAVRANVQFAESNFLVVTVPIGSTYAPITVGVAGLVATSGKSFQPHFDGGSTISTASFAPRVDLTVPTGSGPIFTALGDLDGDGKPDLIVDNAYDHSLSLYRNLSTSGSLTTGSFAPAVTFPVGGSPDNPYGIGVADVDGDGKLDVLICDRIGNRISIYRNTATPGSLTVSSLAPRVDFEVAADPRHVVVGDLNGDGRPEIVATAFGANTISILQNIGTPGTLNSGSFAPYVNVATAAGPYEIAMSDLDSDGRLDFAVVGNANVSVFRNINEGGTLTTNSFAPRIDLPIPADAGVGLAIGDLDGDGKSDIVACTYLSQSLIVYRNVSTPGSLTAGSFVGPTAFNPGCRSHTVAFGDLNGDGRADLGFVGEIPSLMSVYENLSSPGNFNGASLARVDFGTGWNAWGISVGDLDGDTRPDIVFCNSYDDTISIYRNIVPFSNSLPTCVPAPAGLLSWWRAEGNPLDSADGNHGTLAGQTSYNGGMVGQAFQFDGNSDGVQVGNPANLQRQDFTIETWIRRLDPAVVNPSSHDAEFFSYGTGGYAFGITDDGRIFLSKVDVSNVTLDAGLTDTNYHHLAVTKSGGTVIFYIDGVAYNMPAYDPGFAFFTSAAIGARGDNLVASFLGSIDELSIYGRALAATEIQSIYFAGGNGKCNNPATEGPSISMQPTNQMVMAGQPVTFSVTAGGSVPLNYQWYYGGTLLPDGTNSNLNLPNAQPGQDGVYWVVVSNPLGSVQSSNAVLVVLAPTSNPLFSVDLQGIDLTQSLKSGFAAKGSTTNDFWNYYTRDDGFGGFRISGAVPNLRLVDGSVTTVGLTIENAPGAWGTGSTDPMYAYYLYPQNGGNVVITLTNLPSGHYSVLPYSSDGNFEVTVNGVSYGVRHTRDDPLVNPPVWQEGVQYALFSNVTVVAGQDLVLTVRPGLDAVAVIGGLQFEQTGPPAVPHILTQPSPRTNYVGSNVTFVVVATGDPPLSYQWRFNDTPIANKTNASLSLIGLQFANAGNYSVVVSNAFGVAVSSNAALTVLPLPSCTSPPNGLVSWWRFENSDLDNWDSNNGFAGGNGIPFVNGKVGRAHSFNLSLAVAVPDAPSLNFSNAMTVEAWVNPSVNSPLYRTIVTKGNYFLALTNGTQVFFRLSPSNSAASVGLRTAQSIPLNQWSLVMATYDGTAMRVYINGTLAGQSNYAGGIFPSSAIFGIGGIPNGVPGALPAASVFQGMIDEVSVYNRALSQSEIQSIYTSDFIGKCQAPPTILANPVSQAVPQNEDVRFAVTVVGSKPLAYQWQFNGVNIFGATNAFLILDRVQSNRAGFYSVRMTNSLGSVFSAAADLKLLPPLSCVTVPTNVISWWPANLSALDAVDGNHGTLGSGSYATTGKVAQAFSFNGSFARVTIPSSPSLNFGSNVNFSIEGWVKYIAPSLISGLPPTNSIILEKRVPALFSSSVGYSLSVNQGQLAFWFASLPTVPRFPTNTSMFIGGPDLRDGMFHHVAVTLNRGATNGGRLYVDGQPVLTFDPTPRRGDLSTTAPFAIGGSSSTTDPSFNGLIDEFALYSRALTAAEIQSIAGAGSAGKCKEPPVIITQPVSRTVPVGSNVTFSVVATGTPNLRYQWFRNGGVVLSATNSMLNISNVQFSASGNYSVRVANGFGTNNSTIAVLTVQSLASLPTGSALSGRFTGGAMHLSFAGSPGAKYSVEASTNLIDWTVIGAAIENGAGAFEFIDTTWNNRDACFYRIIQD